MTDAPDAAGASRTDDELPPEERTFRARVRRAIDKHGPRGLPFAIAHRALTMLEERVNPRSANLVDFGFSEPVPVSEDPVHALYAVEFQTLVIDVPLAAVRWSRLGVRLDRDNPFVAHVAGYRDGTVTRYDGSALQQYFRRWQPRSAADVLGLDASLAGALANQPAASVVLPWAGDARFVDPDVRLDRVDRWNRAETRAVRTELGVDAGHKHFGPVSDELGELEHERYARLADAVAAKGFKPRVAEGYIGGQFLVHDGAWALLVTGPGLHRAVVAAAFGVDPLRVAIDKGPPMVHRSDVGSWPGVRSGLFSEAAALRVFDRILAGEPPAGFAA